MHSVHNKASQILTTLWLESRLLCFAALAPPPLNLHVTTYERSTIYAPASDVWLAKGSLAAYDNSEDSAPTSCLPPLLSPASPSAPNPDSRTRCCMSDSRPNGVLTVWIATLPRPLSTLVGVFLLLASLAALGAGARSLAVGTSFGRVRGTEEKQGWLQGGVGGIVCGSWAGGASDSGLGCAQVRADAPGPDVGMALPLALVSTLVLLLALSKQAKPALNRWAILAILVVPSLVGAVIGGRWRVGAVLSLSLTSS